MLDALGALVAAPSRTPNASLLAIGQVGADPGWTLTAAVAFSSARKWSGASFARARNLGARRAGRAPRPRATRLRPRVEALAAGGVRVLLLARTEAPLDDRGRRRSSRSRSSSSRSASVRRRGLHPAPTSRHRGWRSRSSPATIPPPSAPSRAGSACPAPTTPVDARTLPDDLEALAEVLDAVLRVRSRPAPPEAGHGPGAAASRPRGGHDRRRRQRRARPEGRRHGRRHGLGQRRDPRLSPSWCCSTTPSPSLPAVVAEGRRVIANVERVANLFVTKSVYAALLALAIGVARAAVPLLPPPPHHHLDAHDRHPRLLPGAGAERRPQPPRLRRPRGPLRDPRRDGGRRPRPSAATRWRDGNQGCASSRSARWP